MRQHNPKKRRAKQHASDHFSHDLWLTDTPRQTPDAAADREDNRHLKKKSNRELGRSHSASYQSKPGMRCKRFFGQIENPRGNCASGRAPIPAAEQWLEEYLTDGQGT